MWCHLSTILSAALTYLISSLSTFAERKIPLMISWSYMCDLCMCGLSSSWYLVFQSKIIPVWMSLHRLGLNEVVWVGYPVVVIVSFSRNGPFPEMFGMIFNKMCCWNSATELPLQLDLVFRHYGCFCKWHTDIYVLFYIQLFHHFVHQIHFNPSINPSVCRVCFTSHIGCIFGIYNLQLCLTGIFNLICCAYRYLCSWVCILFEAKSRSF